MEVSANMKKKYVIQGNRMVGVLKEKGYDAYLVETKEEAKDLALKMITKDKVISFGGSETIKDIGLLQYLRENGYKLIDRDTGNTPEEKDELMRQGLLSDIFLMSANAMTKDGEILNVDGRGNRVAALCFGPKEILMIVGMNKVVGTMEAAEDRVRNFVAPVNSTRLNMDLPCAKTGFCANCHLDKSICSHVVITRHSKPKGRIKVILVAEDLGF